MKYPVPHHAFLSVCMLHRNSYTHHSAPLLGCLIQNGLNPTFQGELFLLLKALSCICVFT